MSGRTAHLGSYAWTTRTGGHLTCAEQRCLAWPLLKTHAVNAIGRLAMATHLNSGRRAVIDAALLTPPVTALTRAAATRAHEVLPPVLLNHSYRTYAFAAAIAQLERVDVDRELLFVSALLHDIGLATGPRPVDFTLAGARAARDVAETVGLSSAATDVVRSAITLHHSPGVSMKHGSVAYLLSAGAGVDVIGLNLWKLPPAFVQDTIASRPRVAFKRHFTDAWRAEAEAVPRGRARYLRRYGAFTAAIKRGPFVD